MDETHSTYIQTTDDPQAGAYEPEQSMPKAVDVENQYWLSRVGYAYLTKVPRRPQSLGQLSRPPEHSNSKSEEQ